MDDSIDVKRMKLASRLCWRYDDKSYHAIKRKGKHVLESKVLRKAQIKSLERDGIVYHEVKAKNAIPKKMDTEELLVARWTMQNATKDGFAALNNLLADYEVDGNGQEVIRLLSLLLMGYTSKLLNNYANQQMLQCSRAPIVLVKRHKSDLCGGFEHLAHIVESIAVDTSINDALLHHNPAVLPDAYFNSTISECAYLQVRGLKKHHKFPAKYRNTSVLIHGSFFSGADIRDFVRRNVWATVAVFGVKALSKADSACLHIDMNRMDLSKRDWDDIRCIIENEQINELMAAFVAWLALESQNEENIERKVTEWVNHGMQVLQKYHFAIVGTKLPILQGSEKRYMWFQVATLRAFLDFCEEMELADKDQIEDTWNRWCNELLPGSRDAEVYRQQEEKKQAEKTLSQETMFDCYEKLLKSFLEDATDTMIARDDNIDWEKYNLKEHYAKRPCVILGQMTPKNKEIGSFFAVKILRDDLKDYSQEHGDEYRDAIPFMWAQKKRGESLRPYIHTNTNLTIKKHGSPYGVVLKLEQLDFLEAGTLKRLQAIANKPK